MSELPCDQMVDGFVETADRLQLYVRDYPPQRPETGCPVVCLHGLSRNGRDFELVAPRIAALGRRAFTIDMRGRGRSDRDPNPQNYQPAIYAQDVLHVLDALGVERAVFVGTSMGGIVTMLIAAGSPDCVAAAVLNDIGPKLEAKGLRSIAAYVGARAPFESWGEAAEAVKANLRATYPNADDEFWAIAAKRLCRALDDGRVAFDYDPGIVQGMADTPEEGIDLSPIFAALSPIPTLLLRGSLSWLISRESIMAAAETSPNLTVVEVPGVGHAPTLEEPSAWLPVVDFLGRRVEIA